MTASVRYKSNRPLVIRKGQDAGEQIGKRMGAFIMTTAKRSLGRPRKDGQPSAPGSPPRASSMFKKNVLFAWDARSRSTVIGPRLLPGKAERDTIEALESGKSTTRMLFDRTLKKRVRKVSRYRPRPFMVPALEKEAVKLPGLWKNAIHV